MKGRLRPEHPFDDEICLCKALFEVAALVDFWSAAPEIARFVHFGRVGLQSF